MNATQTRDLHAILADLADFTVASSGTRAATLYHELEDTLRAQLASLPEGAAGRMAAEADRAARTMAPPVPGVSQNSGYTVRAVIHMHDAERGLLANWSVAGENPETGAWVTWNAYMQDGTRAGKLSYDGGHYFNAVSGPSGLARADNRRRALADLAIRAGTMSDVGLRIANEVTRYHDIEDRRMASRLRRWCQG
jgi:hypothetical protein